MKKHFLFKLCITFLFCMFYQFISAQCEGVSIDGNSNNNIYTFASCNESRFINLQTPFQNPNVSVTPMNGAPNLIYANGGFIFQSINYTVVGLDPQPTPVFDYEVVVSDPANSSTQCKFNLHINIFPCQQILDLKTTLASCDSTNGSILIKMMNSTKINLIDANTQKVVLSKQYGYGFDFNNYDTLKNLKAGSYKIEAWPDYSNNSNPTQIIYATVNIPENLKIESKYKIVCEGNPLTLSAPSSQKYLWSTGETTQSIQVNKGGKYALEVIDPTKPLCKTKDTIDLKFNPRLTLEVIQSYKDCKSDSLDIIYRVKGGTAPYYYQNQPSTGCYEGCLQKADSVFKQQFFSSGYYVLVSDATGCSVEKEYKMLPNASKLKLSYTKNIKLCQGDSTVFNDLYPNEKEFKHQWYLDGQAISQGTKNECFAKKAGKYHVVVTTPWCEVKSDTVIVEVVAPDPIQFVNPIYPTCIGNLVTYQAEKNKSNYEWNIINQTKNIDYNVVGGGTDTSSFLSLIWYTEGPKQISLNYSSGFCKNKVPAIINEVVSSPTHLITNSPSFVAICQGTITTYKVSLSNLMTIQPINLKWEIPGAVPGIDYEIVSFTESEISIKWLKPADYKLSVFNQYPNNYCIGNNLIEFGINVNPIPQPRITADKGMVCFGDVVEYKTEAGNINYEWTIPNKTKDIDYLILDGGDFNSNTMKIIWKSQGFNQVSVNYLAQKGLCYSTTPAYIVTQVQMPVELVHATPEKSDVCLNSIETYKVKDLNSNSLSVLNLNWVVSGDPTNDFKVIAGGTIVDTFITIQWLKASKKSVFVNSIQCGNSIYFDVNVHDIISQIELDIEKSDDVCKTDTLKIMVKNSAGKSVQWYFNDQQIPNATDSVYYAKNSGKYNVLVKNDGSCSLLSDYFEFKKDTCNSSVAGIKNSFKESISMYPNPATTVLTIDTKAENIHSISFIDVLGKSVLYQELKGVRNEVNLEGLAKGMYVVSFFNDQNEIISTQKLSVE